MGFITPEAVYEIAKVKNADGHRWHLPLEGVALSVIGTARSMGIQVRESEDDKVVEEEEEATDATADGAADDGGKKKKGKKGKKKK